MMSTRLKEASVSPGIISSTADLTPDWMTQLLRSSGDLADTISVVSAEPTPFGSDESMMSSLYRVALTFDGATDAPTSLIVKLASQNEGMRFVAGMFRFYEREMRFYNEIASDTPIDTPRCLLAEMYPDDQGFVLVLDEVSGCRQVDQIEGMSFDDAVTTLEALADLHVPFWGKDLGDIPQTLLRYSSDMLKQLIPPKSSDDWGKVRPMLIDSTPAEVVDLLDRILEIWPRVLDDMTEPNTLVHGDCRSDNMLFRPDGSVIMLDFQLMATGHGITDPAYLISQSLDPAAHERASELIEIYLARIASAGIDVDRDRAKVAYGASVIFHVAIALGLLSAEDMPERSVVLGKQMVERASKEILRTGAHLRYA